jgi:hypothetical protein
MSSLLQFDGETGRRGVRLEFAHPATFEAQSDGPYLWIQREPVPCETCGKLHAQLYTAWRRPVGMLGCWVTFRYNGETHAPDLSLPINVERIPRGAVKLTPAENAARWHRS